MEITSQLKGHLIIYKINQWVYADNGILIEKEKRPCIKCGRMPTKEGHDACLGNIPGAKNACCGHGDESYRYTDISNNWRKIHGLPMRRKR